MSETLDGVVAYLVALFLLVTTNLDTITMWGGFILLVVRLIADVPRAVKQIKRWFKMNDY